MFSETRLDESEPISPELVLVSPPELARVARDQLPERPFAVEPSTAPSAAESFMRNGGTHAPTIHDRLPEPPRYPRIVVEEPRLEPPERHRGRFVAAYVLIAGVVGGAAYFLATPQHAQRSEDLAIVTPPTSATNANAKTASTSRPKPPMATLSHHPATKRVGNRTSRPKRVQSPAAKPKPKPKRTARAARFVPARTWTWPTSKGARGYQMRFIVNGGVVLRLRTTQPRAVLPDSFRFRAGTYRWVVKRIPPPVSGGPLVDSKFVLTRASAAEANQR
jgi:hypothetical protein